MRGTNWKIGKLIFQIKYTVKARVGQELNECRLNKLGLKKGDLNVKIEPSVVLLCVAIKTKKLPFTQLGLLSYFIL